MAIRLPIWLLPFTNCRFNKTNNQRQLRLPPLFSFGGVQAFATQRLESGESDECDAAATMNIRFGGYSSQFWNSQFSFASNSKFIFKME